MYNESVKSIRELAEQRVVIRRSFPEAVQYTREHADEIEAIVVNAITEPFFLGSGICPLVESMQPRMIRAKDREKQKNPCYVEVLPCGFGWRLDQRSLPL